MGKWKAKVTQRKLRNQEDEQLFKTNLQLECVVRSSSKWMYDSAQGLNKGLKNMLIRLPSQILGLLRPKLPEVYGCDSLADSQTVDQHQRCTSGRDAVVDTGREERRSVTC